MQTIAYGGHDNCRRLSNGTVELIVPLDIGPRILRYAFAGEENILAELPGIAQTTERGEWKPWGGHRLWAAPEAMPRSYSIDDQPVRFDVLSENTIQLVQPAAVHTANIEKEITVTLDDHGTGVTLTHRITNRNIWGIDVAPWAITIMASGGVAILPQEPYRSHDDYLLPARPLVLWYFTKLCDPRYTFYEKYICIRVDRNEAEPQKIGIANQQKWAAYLRERTLFVKRFEFEPGATYPDFGSNNEVYTARSYVEIESLAPMRHLEPGESAEHWERWNLFHANSGVEHLTDAALDALLAPALAGNL